VRDTAAPGRAVLAGEMPRSGTEKSAKRSWENVGKMRFEAGNIWKIEGLKLPRE